MRREEIIKYIEANASQKEQLALENWIASSEENAKEFYRIKVEYLLATFKETADRVSVDEAYARFLHARRKTKQKRLFPKLYAVAAVLLLGMTLIYVFRKDRLAGAPIETKQIVVSGESKILSGRDKAILTLENGAQVVLGKEGTYQSENAIAKGDRIVYKVSTDISKEISYNTLMIPRAAQFFLILADGTQVWLNSDSQLRYPVNFIEGRERVVELMYGEAYFDVSPSEDHKGAPFRVKHSLQEVKVLGTEFNIKAYSDEPNVYTTLLEGKVTVQNQSHKASLDPRQQSTVNSQSDISVKEVDVETITDWKRGVFSFKGKSLSEIAKSISRWYDVKIIIQNEKLRNITLKGTIKKSNELKTILEIMRNASDISSYEIKDNTVYIK